MRHSIRPDTPPIPAPTTSPLVKKVGVLVAVIEANMDKLRTISRKLADRLEGALAELKALCKELLREMLSAPGGDAFRDSAGLLARVLRGMSLSASAEASCSYPISVRVAVNHRTGWPGR